MSDSDLLEVIDEIYAAALEPERWPHVLTSISRAVGGVGGLLLPVSLPNAMTAICSPEMVESTVEYEKGWWRLDSRTSALRRRSVTGGIHTDPDYFSNAEMARDPFYQDFLRPAGLGHCLAHVSAPISGLVTTVSVQRALNKGAFERIEKDRLAVLGHHTARAISVAVRIGQSDSIGRQLAATVNEVSSGIILLDERGAVSFMNCAAEKLLGDALSVRRGHLCCARTQEQRQLDRLIATATSGLEISSPGSIALPRPDGRAPLLIQVIPIDRSSGDRFQAMALGSGGVLVLVTDLAAGGRPIEHHLVELGLTPGQARVAAAVGYGRSTREAAEILGLQDESVRTVLKRIYLKLGISRQSELAVIVAKLNTMPG